MRMLLFDDDDEKKIGLRFGRMRIAFVSSRMLVVMENELLNHWIGRRAIYSE